MQFEKLRRSAAPPRARSLKYRSLMPALCAAAAIAGAPVATRAQVNVLTYHNDIARTGQNLNESFLIPGNVNTAQFGKLFAQGVDGLVYAQPLYVSNVSIPGKGVHNVVYVATEKDNVYAFDADSGSPAAYWTKTFTNAAAGITPISSADTKSCCDIGPDIGITSTPVIDAATGTMYVVAATKENGKFFQRLHALDIATGSEKFNGPVPIVASIKGGGDGGTPDGNLAFDPLREGQRPGLLLQSSKVYICWASHGDNTPYHGWIMAYDASTLTQIAVFNTTPNGSDGGIWESANGPAVDAAGNIYVVTGNGSFDVNLGGSSYGDSYLKLSNINGINVIDYFTPFDQAALNSADLDVGSSGAVVIPDQQGLHKHILVGASKNGTLYVMDRDNLGKFTSGKNACLQTIVGPLKGAFSSPAYFNGQIYYMTSGEGSVGVLQAFTLSGGFLNPNPASKSSVNIGYPGSTPSISANGSQSGVVWLIDPASIAGGPAILRAFDASNVASELYNSSQAPLKVDNPGVAIKWATPTIANGKVFIATSGQLAVYGLKPNSLTPLLTLTSDSVSFPGGGSTTAHATLSAAAPASSAIVNLSTDTPSLVTVPSTITIPSGGNAGTFSIKTNNVNVKTTVTVFATSGGITKSISLDILPTNPAGFSVALQPTMQAGSTSPANIFLNIPQSTSVTFTLSSSNPSVLSVPASVVIVGGGLSAPFTCTAGIVSSTQTVNVTATSSATGSTDTASILVTLLPGSTFPSGMNFFSVPMDYSNIGLDTLFGYSGVKLAVWNPSTLTWALTPTPPANQIHAGRGYWARFPTAVTLTKAGQLPVPTQDFHMQLSLGWNQIGNPFTSSVALNSLTFALGRLTFHDASSSAIHVINPNVYRYNAATGQYVTLSPTDPLVPGVGYWMQSYIDTDFTVPHL